MEAPFSLWVCRVIGHGYHDSDSPCPDGVVPAPEDVSDL